MTRRWIYRNWQKLLTAFLTMLVLCVISLPSVASSFAGLGGYIGEKILGDGTNEVLYLGDGTHTNQILGSVPTITTTAPTNSKIVGGVPQLTLNGIVSSLNGMPTTNVWFVWGYSPLFLVNSTPNVTINSTGSQSVNISGMLNGVTVYSRIMASTDAVVQGNTVSSVSGGGVGAGINFGYIVIPLVIAAAILLFILMRWNNLPLALAGAIIGFIALRVALSLLQSLF